MRVLFLDFDGVLNGHEWCHLGSKTPRINRRPAEVLQAILDLTTISVVISSTWARHIEEGDCTPAGFAFLLRTHGIKADVVDGINGRVTDPQERVVNIKQWLTKTPAVSHWLVIDDMPLNLPHNHIRPNPAIGLTPVDVTNAKRIIA